jgi:hypothetical protein
MPRPLHPPFQGRRRARRPPSRMPPRASTRHGQTPPTASGSRFSERGLARRLPEPSSSATARLDRGFRWPSTMAAVVSRDINGDRRRGCRRFPLPGASMATRKTHPHLLVIRGTVYTHPTPVRFAGPIAVDDCPSSPSPGHRQSSRRPYLRVVRRASTQHPRSNHPRILRQHREVGTRSRKTEGKIKAWCQVGRKRWMGIMILRAKDDGAGATWWVTR